MDTTAFGYSSFGHNSFGQSSVNSTITLECAQTVYQVAIWYIEGLSHRREIFDIGTEFGDTGFGGIGKVTQQGNLVQVLLNRECFVIAIYLFDTDEDLSYLHFLDDWHVDTVFPQLSGATREWDEGNIFAVSEPFPEVILVEQSKTPDPYDAIQEIPPDLSPSLAVQSGGDGISITVSTTDVEEF